VIRIYLDGSLAEIEGAGDRTVDPDAIRALSFLAGDHELVIVGAADEEPPADLRALATETVTHVPPLPPEVAWYLTTDVDRCQGTSARLRTVLIGAPPPGGSIHRCNSVARDVQAAVLEILAAEAMPA